MPCLLDGVFNDQRENKDMTDYDVSVLKSPSPPYLGHELSDGYIHPDLSASMSSLAISR